MLELLIKSGTELYGWSELSYDVAQGMYNKGVLRGEIVTIDSWEGVVTSCYIDDTRYDGILDYLYANGLNLSALDDLTMLNRDDRIIVKMLRYADEGGKKLVDLTNCTVAVLDQNEKVAYVTDCPAVKEALVDRWGGTEQLDNPQILEDYEIVDVLISDESKHDIGVMMGKKTLADYIDKRKSIWIVDEEDRLSEYPNNPEDYKEDQYGEFIYRGSRYRIAQIKSAKEL